MVLEKRFFLPGGRAVKIIMHFAGAQQKPLPSMIDVLIREPKKTTFIRRLAHPIPSTGSRKAWIRKNQDPCRSVTAVKNSSARYSMNWQLQ